jgi:hypothetical protein
LLRLSEGFSLGLHGYLGRVINRILTPVVGFLVDNSFMLLGRFPKLPQDLGRIFHSGRFWKGLSLGFLEGFLLRDSLLGFQMDFQLVPWMEKKITQVPALVLQRIIIKVLGRIFTWALAHFSEGA